MGGLSIGALFPMRAGAYAVPKARTPSRSAVGFGRAGDAEFVHTVRGVHVNSATWVWAGGGSNRRVFFLHPPHALAIHRIGNILPNSTAELREPRAEVVDIMTLAADHFTLLPLCQRCRDAVVQDGSEKSLPGDRSTMVV